MTTDTDPNDASADPHHEYQPVGKYCPHGLSWRVHCWCCTQEHDEAMRKIQTEELSRLTALFGFAEEARKRFDAAQHNVAEWRQSRALAAMGEAK